MARKMHIPTEEEIERDKLIILKLFQNGIPMRRMQANYGFKMGYIKRVRKELIADGLITIEEIKEAYNKYMVENPAAQGLDKSKARQKSNTEKADARHSKSIAKKEKVLELVKLGKATIEIANEMQISETSVNWFQKQLIEESRLTPEEIVKIPNGEKAVSIDRTAPEYIAQRDAVIQYLKLGWKNGAIRKHLNISPFYMNIYVRDIKSQGWMKAKDIEIARLRKRQEDISSLEEHIKAGYKIDIFREIHPEFTYNEVTPLIKELIAEGKITREQVNENRRNAARNTLNKDVQLSPDEQLDFIIQKVKKGYSPQEILKSDKTKSLTMYKILYQKRRIIAQGIISQEEADEAMAKRQDKKLNRKYERIIDRIRELTMHGYSLREIAEKIGYSYEYICNLKNKEAKENGWFTNEELKEFKIQRQMREYEELPQEDKDRIEEEKRQEKLKIEKEKEQRQADVLDRRRQRKNKTQADHQEKLKKIKQYALKGKSVSEIANLMGVSKEHIYALQYESQRNGTWLSDEEIAVINKKRQEKRENATKKRHEKKARALELEKKQRLESEEQRKMQELWQLRELAIQGLSNEEMAKVIHYSIARILVLKRTATQKGIWFSDEDIKYYKVERIRKEAEAEAKRQEAERKRIEKERREVERAIKEEQENLKRLEREKRRKIKSYNEEYNIAKRAAKKEDKLEMNGEEDVSTIGRKKLVDVLIKLYEAGAIISEADIELIMNAIYMHSDFADKNNLKFLIANAARSGGLDSAERITVELITALEDTKYREPLYQYRKWIQQQRIIDKIKQLKGQGLNNNQIAKKLNISSAEVVVFLDNASKKVDFFGDDGNR